jgi:hypothetical protein
MLARRRQHPHPPNDEDASTRWMRRARLARAWIAVLASLAALVPALATAVEALARALR